MVDSAGSSWAVDDVLVWRSCTGLLMNWTPAGVAGTPPICTGRADVVIGRSRPASCWPADETLTDSGCDDETPWYTAGTPHNSHNDSSRHGYNVHNVTSTNINLLQQPMQWPVNMAQQWCTGTYKVDSQPSRYCKSWKFCALYFANFVTSAHSWK